MTILRQIRIYDDTNQGTSRRAQQQPPPQDYGRLRRSGSFQKLRQSIRRGSEKLVQKLRGAPVNSPSYNTMPFQQQDAPMKRASSMSVLNNAPVQQQQQTNKPLMTTNTLEPQRPSSSSFFRGRLASAENLH